MTDCHVENFSIYQVENFFPPYRFFSPHPGSGAVKNIRYASMIVTIIRDYEDEGPLSLPVTDKELQRQADGQILRSDSEVDDDDGGDGGGGVATMIYLCLSIRQGSMWQARERLFSRWKERFFTLTR